MRIYMIRRRDDTEDIALRIRDQLLWRYGKDCVAPDLWAKTLEDYAGLVHQWMAVCDVVLVLLGSHWLDATDAAGRRCLDNPYDPVHLEVGTALRLNKLVIPVLVRGASMPAADALPPDLASLTLRQGMVVRGDPAFQADMGALVQRLNQQLTWRPASPLLLVVGIVLLISQCGWEIALPGSHGQGTPVITNVTYLGIIGMVLSFVLASGYAFYLALVRRQRIWLSVLGLFCLIGLALLVVTPLVYFWLYPYTFLLIAFSLWGRRKEAA